MTTILSNIEGLDSEIQIESENGRWVRFVKKNRGNNDSLQKCYEKSIDANQTLDSVTKTRLKQRQIDR